MKRSILTGGIATVSAALLVFGTVEALSSMGTTEQSGPIIPCIGKVTVKATFNHNAPGYSPATDPNVLVGQERRDATHEQAAGPIVVGLGEIACTQEINGHSAVFLNSSGVHLSQEYSQIHSKNSNNQNG